MYEIIFLWNVWTNIPVYTVSQQRSPQLQISETLKLQFLQYVAVKMCVVLIMWRVPREQLFAN